MKIPLEDLPRTRQEALASGSIHFYTGVPCKRGHLDARFTSIGTCRTCGNLASRSRAHQAAQSRKIRSYGVVPLSVVATPEMATVIKQLASESLKEKYLTYPLLEKLVRIAESETPLLISELSRSMNEIMALYEARRGNGEEI